MLGDVFHWKRQGKSSMGNTFKESGETAHRAAERCDSAGGISSVLCQDGTLCLASGIWRWKVSFWKWITVMNRWEPDWYAE